MSAVQAACSWRVGPQPASDPPAVLLLLCRRNEDVTRFLRHCLVCRFGVDARRRERGKVPLLCLQAPMLVVFAYSLSLCSLLAAASQVHRRMDALLRNTTSLGRLEEDARRALEAGSGRVRRVNAQGELAEAAMAVERKLEGVHHILQASLLPRRLP